MTLNNVVENTFQLEKVLFNRNQNQSKRIKYRTYANQLTVLNHIEKHRDGGQGVGVGGMEIIDQPWEWEYPYS